MTTENSLVIHAGTLIDGIGGIIKNANIGIVNGLIKEVSKNELNLEYKSSLDYSSKFVMPGLIDAHVHIRYGKKPDPVQLSDEYQALRGLRNVRKALFAGVTTLGDAGALRNISFAVRNVINDGVVFGPRLYTCGEMITMTGGRSRKPGERLEVDGADSARNAVRKLLMYKGADFIKLGATGAISSPHTGPRHPQLTIEEMTAATDEAHKCGKKVHSHCYGEEGISNSIEAGVDVIVHGQTLTDEHIKKMKKREIILLPTLKTFCEHVNHTSEGGVHERIISTGIWDETEPNFKNALNKGVIIAMGTDAGMPDNLFGDNPRDLEYMTEWGMIPNQAILAGTINAATSLGIQDILGTIEENKLADIIVLEKNPLEDISNIRKTLKAVVLNGRLINLPR